MPVHAYIPAQHANLEFIAAAIITYIVAAHFMFQRIANVIFNAED